jgi:hypothetical protein
MAPQKGAPLRVQGRLSQASRLPREEYYWRSLTSIINCQHIIHIYLIPSPNIGIGFKLTNSTSFGESVFFSRVYPEIRQRYLIVRLQHIYPWCKLLGMDLEHTRRQPTEGGPEGLPCAGWPMGPSHQSSLQMAILYRLLDCIYAILLSQFNQ